MRRYKGCICLLLVVALLCSMAPSAAGSAYTAYAVEGGNIYFDPATGGIVDCDTSVTAAVIPEKIGDVTVTSIGREAFHCCRSLASLTVPATVTSVGRSAFYDCYSLTKLDFPGVTYIGILAFQDCSGLTDISVGGATLSVDGGAFRNCYALTNVVFSGEVTYLGNYAFDYCESLKELSVTGKDLAIGNYTFNGCDKLEKVQFSGVVKSIGEMAFFCCYELREINLTEGLVSIGMGAFCSSPKLTTFHLPASLTTLGESALQSGSGLLGFTVAEGNQHFSTDAYGVLYDFGKTELICYPRASSVTSFTVPDTVTKIRDGVFSTCENLQEVVLPDGITEIGPNTFLQCYSLKSIKLPASLKTIGTDAFTSCWNLQNIELPAGLTNIGEQAFSGCRNLEEVSIPGGVKTISRNAFNGCRSLRNLVLQEGIEQIGVGAFYGCSGLCELTLPASVTVIGSNAFYECSALTDVVLPEGVTSIGVKAFYHCYNLTFAVLPSTLKTLGSDAFALCYDLKAVNIPDGVTSIVDTAFHGCDQLTIFGKTGSLAEDYANRNEIPFTPDQVSNFSGFVLTADAKPVPNVVVSLVDTADGGVYCVDATDANGLWCIPYARMGHTYRLVYDHAEYPDNGVEYVCTISEKTVKAEPIIVAKTGFRRSGTSTIDKLSYIDLNYLMMPEYDTSPLYEVEPSLSQPYSSGKVTQRQLELGLARLNQVRRIAGVPSVALSEKANTYCQDASLVVALNWYLSHYPSRPSGMDDALYQSARTGAANSNLATHPDRFLNYGPIGVSVDLYMDDSDESNVADVGHRRWALNPTMAYTGFGCVKKGTNYFSAMYAMDQSGPQVDYDFIAWPSSGNFPSELNPDRLAWSVTLNPKKYNIPNKSDLKITMTEVATGNQCVLYGDRTYSTDTLFGAGEYLNLSLRNIGVANCIIFRPTAYFTYQNGVYTVEIEGVTSFRGGSNTVLRYYVNICGNNRAETETEYGMANYGLEWHRDQHDNLWISGVSELSCRLAAVSYDASGRLIDTEFADLETLEDANVILDCPDGSLVRLFRLDEAGRPMTAVWSHQF